MNNVKCHPTQTSAGQGTFGLVKYMNYKAVFNKNGLLHIGRI